MNKEIWKDIPGYEGLYQVSNFGNVISLCNRWGKRKEPRKVSQHITKKGYKRIGLHKNNKSKLFMVHDLVAKTFIKDFTYPEEVNHKDKIRTNNNLDNLEIILHSDNVRYSKAKEVIQYDLQGNYIREWNCIIDIEKELKIDHRQICDCCKKKQKTCHNYIWKYKEEI